MMPEKYIFYLLLLSILVIGCSPAKQLLKKEVILPENEYVKANVVKTGSISFGIVNPGWTKSNHEQKKDSVVITTEPQSPNPFSPSSKLQWIVAEPDSFLITLFDQSGNKISTLFRDYLSTGSYEMNFIDTHVNSGVYFISMNIGKEKYYKQFILLK